MRTCEGERKWLSSCALGHGSVSELGAWRLAALDWFGTYFKIPGRPCVLTDKGIFASD